MTQNAELNTRSFYHGTRADLKVGDLLCAGYPSNFPEEPLSWIYFTETLDAAMWGAQLAAGEDRQRIYIVEPTGPFFDDPNLTDKRFPGNRAHAAQRKDLSLTVSQFCHIFENMRVWRTIVWRLELWRCMPSILALLLTLFSALGLATPASEAERVAIVLKINSDWPGNG
nr:NAD(+)--rifampin ADP-ribosyltransferase [Rhizobium leguminosarum]